MRQSGPAEQIRRKGEEIDRELSVICGEEV